jgi:hypothetical protein|tara:strand:+ start:174 stop:323 length:150 start_codon:yes stop_codon:yes gene_type:complete
MSERKHKKVEPPKERNWLAVHAHNRNGGPMKDQKKEASKKKCRGKVKED